MCSLLGDFNRKWMWFVVMCSCCLAQCDRLRFITEQRFDWLYGDSRLAQYGLFSAAVTDMFMILNAHLCVTKAKT